MSQSKFLYSLPKTQPTLSSSSKTCLSTNDKIDYLGINTSPQVSAFTTDEKYQQYTHNMNIDYGKLSRPFHEELKKIVRKDIDMSQDLTLLLSTRKFKNLKQYTLNDTCMDSAQKQGIERPIHALLTQKKAFSTQKLQKAANPQSSNKVTGEKQKKKNRIISVKAYETSDTSFLAFSHQNSQFPTGKKMSNTKQTQDKIMQQQTVRADRSDRKISSHSRIIKTFNPASGIQTKIITYPDLTEVIRLRESRKKGNW